MKKVGRIFTVLLCMIMCIFCASGQSVQEMGAEDAQIKQGMPDIRKEEGQNLQPEQELGGEKGQDLYPEQDFWPEEGVWANSHETRICYKNGYYYYASQRDHYYLYRAGADGSQPQCLAKVHSGSICVRDDEIYFVNLSDGNGIYRMGTDGSGMEKLCDYGWGLQIIGEYVFFCSACPAAYDRTGMEAEAPSEADGSFLYRMRGDGSEPELIAANVWKYVPGYENGQGNQEADFLYYSSFGADGIFVRKIDLDGQKEEQICYFDTPGNMMVYGDSIYCASVYYRDRERIRRYCFGDGEITTFRVPEYTDCCIYNGRFYGMSETTEGNGRKVTIYRMDHDMKGHEVLYEDSFSCEYNVGYVSDLYASGEGLFFRKFVSPAEGCQWFRLTENDRTGEWTAEEWEDRERVPAMMPAEKIENEWESDINMPESTEGYEDCLAEDLEYEEFYRTDEEGMGYNSYKIWLPQFNSKVAGYQEINRYFRDVYREALEDKEDFFAALEAEEPDSVSNWYQLTGYCYVYIGEDYVTVAGYRAGYQGGIRNWVTLEPVSFDRESGEPVSLGEILGMSEQEAVAELTGSVYKYMEGVGRGTFLLKDKDLLTENYDPEQFILCPDGIGIYYQRYAIDSGAAGASMYIIPYGDAGNAGLQVHRAQMTNMNRSKHLETAGEVYYAHIG